MSMPAHTDPASANAEFSNPKAFFVRVVTAILADVRPPADQGWSQQPIPGGLDDCGRDTSVFVNAERQAKEMAFMETSAIRL